MPDPDAPRSVEDVLARLEAVADHDHVLIAEIMEAFGDTAFVPMLMVPALLVTSPLSGIPLFSSVCGLTIAVIAAQKLLGRRRIRLPGALQRRGVSARSLLRGARAMHSFASWLDRHSRKRLSFLYQVPLVALPLLACLLSGLAMPFLEAVPFSSSILGVAVLCQSVGFLARDGLYFLAGASFMGGAAAVPVLVLTGLFSG